MTVRVGVIGVGMIGQDHIRRLSQVLSGASVVAVTDVDPSRAQAVADGLTGVAVHATGQELIADENVPAAVLEALRSRGHDVLWVRTEMPGTADHAVLDRLGLRPVEAQQGGEGLHVEAVRGPALGRLPGPLRRRGGRRHLARASSPGPAPPCRMMSWAWGRRSIGKPRPNSSGSSCQPPAICGESDEVAHVSMTSGSPAKPPGTPRCAAPI